MYRKAVGWLEIGGAAWAGLAMASLLYRTGTFRSDPWFSLLALGGCTLVGLAGVQLLKGTDAGEVLSWVVQVLQLGHLTAGDFALRFLAGPHFTVSLLATGEIRFYAGITASLNLLRGSGDPAFAVGINLVAVAAMLMLLRMPSNPRDGR